MRKLTIVFFEAGGGHRNAADALKTSLESQPQAWDVSLLNIQELLDSLDVVRTTTGVRLQDVYNLILRKGWTRLSPQLLIMLRSVVRVYHSRTVKALQKYWYENPADLVLSVIPHFNRALAESVSEREIPFVTLLTDFADYPPHFWIERESQFIICGTARAKQQALALGHPEDRVFETSGMVLKPKFYEKSDLMRESKEWSDEKKKLGLERDLRTGIVLFGGHGSPAMLEIAQLLEDSENNVQLIMLCGHNEKLATELRAIKTKRPMLVKGFTSQVDHYMALADFFIGKPGPGCISEALQFDLPLIVECNSRTLPQERYNAQWLSEKRLGVSLNSFAEISSGVSQLLDTSNFPAFQNNARNHSNRALFEVPVILNEIFAGRSRYSVTEAPYASGMDWADHRPAWASL